MAGNQQLQLLSQILAAMPEANLQLPDPQLLNYYENLENRVYWIDSEIDNAELELCGMIIRWNKEDRMLPIKERQPIKIFFNSVGGSLDIAETLISVIRLSKTPIIGIALGMVASAASLIFLSCHRRIALKNAYFIFHQGSCENIGGNFNEIQAAMEDYRAQVEKMKQFYIDNTSYPEEVIKEKIKTDWYIRGDELIEHDIIHDWIEDITDLL